MITLILALFDILSGIILSTTGFSYYEANGFVITLSVIMALKGIWFLIAEQTGKKRGMNRIEGAINVIGAALLALVFFGIPFSLYAIIGVLLIISGAWRLFEGLVE